MVKLGFIGCGGISRYHAKIIREHVKGIQICAGADISTDALEAFNKETGVNELYRDYREMLKRADINSVCIGLPTGLHAEAAIAAAEAKKHVFCEKPMARTLREADAMIEACRKAGVKLMIGQVRRYDADWGTFRRLVQSGVIGRPVLWRQMAGSAGPSSPWFMDDKMGGGPFLDGCVHNWDFANYTFGEPMDVLGSIMRFRETTALDTGSVIVRYRSGDEVVLCWSWGLPRGARPGTNMDVLGPKGVIRFPGMFDPKELPEGFDQQKYGAYLVDTGAKKRIVKFRKNNMFAEEWRDFVSAVTRNRTPKVTGEIAKLALAVGLAALKAGSSRKPVKIHV